MLVRFKYSKAPDLFPLPAAFWCVAEKMRACTGGCRPVRRSCGYVPKLVLI